MNWEKVEIVNDVGELVHAQAPVIISASRSTDIPTFYADWFVERWKRGYIKWKNPFNGIASYVSFNNTRVVVFWTKNPRPIMKQIDFLNKEVKNFYFQFTLNDYEKEGYEGKVPKLSNRLDTFKELSDRIGKEKVVWRFDPLILTDAIDVQELLKRVKNIGDKIKNHTNKLVFSFADISAYRKVENNLKKEGVNFIEFTEQTMHEFAIGIQQLNKSWGLEIATCAEKIPLEQYEISHNKCIDDDLMVELFHKDETLMDFLGVKIDEPNLFNETPSNSKPKYVKDKGQRQACGCIMSKDVGQYNTCPHGCNYCYANTSMETAIRNYRLHVNDPVKDSIL